MYQNIIDNLDGDKNKYDWLVNAEAALQNNKDVSYHVICLVSALLIISHDIRTVNKALSLLREIADREQSIVCIPGIFFFKFDLLCTPIVSSKLGCEIHDSLFSEDS